MTFNVPENAILLADSSRGVFIPQFFAESHIPKDWDFSECYPDSIGILKNGPDNPVYWDAWSDVLDNAKTIEGHILWPDYDLWVINPNDLEWW